MDTKFEKIENTNKKNLDKLGREDLLDKPRQPELPKSEDKKEPILEQHAEYVPQQLIVKFKEGISANAINSLKQDLKAEVVAKTESLGVELWEIGTASVEKAIASYSKSSFIEYIEPNYVVSLGATIPNDPSFDQLWGLNNTGQTGGTPDADIDAPEAWDIETGSSEEVVVGVIDTGVDYNHPDLVDNIWTNPGETAGDGIDNDSNGFVDDIHGYDFVNNDGDPLDDEGHGTHVSGTIAGRGNNNVGVTGVSHSAKIMGLKFLDASGSGDTFGAIQAIEYATIMGADLTNNSWGGGGYSQALYDAIAEAGEAGQLFIAAAGNDYGNDNDTNPSYPASYDLDNIIGVASTDRNDGLSDFSNIGETSVDLGAPGSDIYSTFPGNSYTTLSGTSMATPHVSGVASLLWSQFPEMTAEQVKNRILNSVDPIAALEGKTATGGRLNAYRAIAEAGKGAVSGIKWNDLDVDGVKDANEPGLEGWTIYLDKNENGVLDSAVSTVNSSDIPKPISDYTTIISELNVSGLDAIEDVNVTLNITHTYDADLDVTLVSPEGTEIELFTNVGGGGDNFSNTSLDDEAATSITAGFAPFNGSYKPQELLTALDGEDPNGVWQLKVTDEAGADIGTLNSWSLDITAPEPSTETDANGNYAFNGLEPDTYTVAEIQQSGWEQTFPEGDGAHTVTVAADEIVEGVDFGNRDTSVGVIKGIKWNDVDGDGVKDATEAGLENWTIYIDENDNGVFDQELSTVNSIDVPQPISDYTTTISELNVGELDDPIADVNVTLDITHTYDADLDVILVSPEGTEIELFTNVGGGEDNFSNTTLDDEAATSITAGVAPFNGSFQPEELLSVLDGENASGTWQLKVIDEAGGDVGTLNSWSLDITTSEPSAQTDADGNYAFTNLEPGTYTIAEVQQEGWEQTFPDGDGTYTVDLEAGEIVNDINFGNQAQPGEIRGIKWSDADSDGVFDASEEKLSGWTIFLDENQNGELDAGETSTVTDADGEYEFTDLDEGTYTVAEVLKDGWIQTSPQALSNPGFESGDFSDWETVGNSSIETSAFNSGPAEGTYQALLTNGTGSVTDANLESLLELGSGSLDGLGNGNATEGSAIKRTVTVSAGDKLTFDWNFLTGEATPNSFYNDFGFVAIASDSASDTINTLANTNSSFSPSTTIFPNETGFGTFSHTFTDAGTYTIGVGVMDVQDTAVDSGVLVDNFSLTDSEGNALPGPHTVEIELGDVVEGVNFGNLQVEVPPEEPGEPGFGTPEDDVLNIFDAPVIVFAGDGDDIVDASPSSGGNRLYGGNGDDELFASTNDRLFGEAGNDILDASAGTGNNRLYGGDGNDMLFAGSNDFLFAGNGSDMLFAGNGDNTLTGGNGADQFWVANASIPTSANTITDFELDTDLIGIGGLSDVNAIEDLSLVQSGDDTRISVFGQELAVLKNTQAASLNNANFVFA